MGTLALIAAVADDRIIGRDNALPWHLPADLRRFRALTLGKPIVMGRRTYQSIGRPLPGRTNIVVTRDAAFAAPGCLVAGSVEGALALAGGAAEVMIIGGASLYAACIDRAARVYLTRVHAAVPGDTRFPHMDPGQWREESREEHPADAANALPMSFVVYARVDP